MNPSAGYSGTPLARKLGVRAGACVLARNAPPNYLDLLKPLPEDVVFVRRLSRRVDLAHLFCEQRAELNALLTSCRRLLRADAAVWISWPKRASKRPTDITEDVVRAMALPLGWVDIKVCAVDEVWSGLKLVVRKELR